MVVTRPGPGRPHPQRGSPHPVSEERAACSPVTTRSRDRVPDGCEQHEHGHPKIAEVAVIGVANPKTGEHACAVVVPVDPADPPTLPELRDFLLGTGLSDRKVPEQLELV